MAKSSSVSFTKHNVTHESESKWSIYLSHTLHVIFNDIGLKDITIEKTDDIVMFKIPVLTLRSKKSIVIQNSSSASNIQL
jgi:hypothetical protein